MKHFITIACLLICITTNGAFFAQTNVNRLDSILPVRGLAIAAPSVQKMDVFLKFIEEELAPGHFNLLILRVDWNMLTSLIQNCVIPIRLPFRM